MKFRQEKDSMGQLNVPDEALYGATTQRALLNFPISDLRFNRTFIKSLAEIKLCAAKTNLELGEIEKNIAEKLEKQVTNSIIYTLTSKNKTGFLNRYEPEENLKYFLNNYYCRCV